MRFLLLLASLSLTAYAFELPASSTQCIVGIAENWNSSHASLQFYTKAKGAWQPVGTGIPARLGKSGLAWGIGIHPTPTGATLKQEGDWRAPAGVFTLGGVWGYAPDIKRHLILPHDPQTPWEKKQQMKQSDPAHALKLFIHHNAPDTISPGMGSSIFFHIWRANGTKPSAGCTTMAESNLKQIIARIDPTQNPLYILLPRTEYESYRKLWKLP